MGLVEPPSVAAHFAAALDRLVADVREDRAVLAAILCGSLSHDTVWAGSDIDLVLVTADDRKPERGGDGGRSLYADGVNVHAMLLPRAAFRATLDGATGNSFMHSYLAKGRLLYTHDETIAELLDSARVLGARDTRVQVLRAAASALLPVAKAHKWLLTRGDVTYSALWILYAATPLAQMEVMGRGLLADREVIVQALALDPAFFGTIYSRLLDAPATGDAVQAALDAIDRRLAERAPSAFAPVLDYLRDAGEARTATEIETHFARTCDVAGATAACEYLADQGLLGKAGVTARLTKRSTAPVQELAFYYRTGLQDVAGEFSASSESSA